MNEINELTFQFYSIKWLQNFKLYFYHFHTYTAFCHESGFNKQTLYSPYNTI